MSEYFQAVIDALIIAALSVGRLNKCTALLLVKPSYKVKMSFHLLLCSVSSLVRDTANTHTHT